ncbi:enolase C-terminal domain-like protein [Mycolicibacterium sp.]|uniref:enolase C-terminal domain-like protein n=1 Tax=Mycolicibacterium sp. TaxID=2320850 RepID=UPI001A30446B|nr:enolase C-terminal domain-like protein [Mycolicibacterium sp.]MBJ7399084.1 O-succinylbenzoate synthase [Mycolicibacterium sp.]
MKTWIDFDEAPVFAIPLTDEVDGLRVHEGMLIEGPQGWGEFSAPSDCSEEHAGRWLTASIEAGTVGWPDPVRGRVPVAITVPAVSPVRAREMVAGTACRTAAVRVGGPMAEDVARVEAVRDALGPAGAIRCDAGGSWDVDAAVTAIEALDRAAGGLQFVEQPCRTLAETARLRRRVSIPIAIPINADLARAELSASADIAMVNVGALGGVRRSMRVAEMCGLPCVVVASLQSSIGMAAGLALAGVLPDIEFDSELATVGLLTGDLVSAGRTLIPVDGYLPVAPMPAGPDATGLARFVVTNPTTIARWRKRLKAAQRHI